ncbi:MAG: hypothetical protein HYW57_08405 [Ignavibacteriales bacterium]|nr:hypothetical protein [Ignavibacteriales bacterium]
MRTSALVRGTVWALLLVHWSCKREIPLSTDTEPINGFRIEGTVSDGLGRPLAQVQIRLFYEFIFESNTPEPSRSYALRASSESVEVRVVDASNRIIRTVFSGLVTDSVITVLWDGRLADGSEAAGGKYTVQYHAGGSERASYVVLVHGTVSATSDVNGRFIIPQESLPLAQTGIPLYSLTDQFLGLHATGRRVELELKAGTTVKSILVNVEENFLTRVNVVL